MWDSQLLVAFFFLNYKLAIFKSDHVFNCIEINPHDPKPLICLF